MKTISFSVDKEMAKEIDKIAKEEKKSKSDVFREIFNGYMFQRTLARTQRLAAPKIRELGLETDDDFEKYLG